MNARAVLFSGPGLVEIGGAEVPEPSPGELLVEAAYSCISPGTELRCLAGQQPGQVDWPYVPGYAMAGRVVAAGDGTTTPIGAAVLCRGTSRSSRRRLWGGHISHAVVPEAAVFRLPANLPLLDAPVAILAAVAYHGVRISRPQPHEKVAVIGLGAIGQLSARIHALTGATVVAADLSPERVDVARKAGIEALVPTGPLEDAFRPRFPDGADVVVDATGAPAVFRQAISLAKGVPWGSTATLGARVLVQGSYPAEFPVPYQAAFEKELAIYIPRNAPAADIQAVLDLMARGRLSVDGVVTEVSPPEDAPSIYAELRGGKGQIITAAFRWQP